MRAFVPLVGMVVQVGKGSKLTESELSRVEDALCGVEAGKIYYVGEGNSLRIFTSRSLASEEEEEEEEISTEWKAIVSLGDMLSMTDSNCLAGYLDLASREGRRAGGKWKYRMLWKDILRRSPTHPASPLSFLSHTPALSK